MLVRILVAAFAALTLAACNERAAAPLPPPQALNAEAIGRYCGMNVLEHPGPKGQIVLASRIDPVWFSSARDAVAFTMMPDEPRDIRAIYVSDMGRAESWDTPGAENWVEARKAVFVIESDKRGGMGTPEAVPFGERAAAETFAARHGGRIVGFKDIPRDYVLGSAAEAEAAPAIATDGSHAHAR
ncbi:MAG: nitrous oxide reductase accessory protein NosL [Rhodoplanes sp.]|uniref:nitrous oxide reductase accessory protein NosL n=1 Tax=Rhodoplanes sp. TaxID=1968906 RepID=UPI0017AB3C52|nr:nitrous oxide reductase accessory protein NosL [Rhodoplanes sp.]NVO12462.1 nitrous oxide reductase accessory protein NosL [Rhodoplanes sp.]